MIDQSQLQAFSDEVARKFGARDAHAIFARFMCKCLPLIQEWLPAIGHKGVKVAREFWLEGVGDPDDLIIARVECWKYLDEKGSGPNVKDREDAAMRALICVLYAEPESDDFSKETIHWFATMLDRICDFSAHTKDLMQI